MQHLANYLTSQPIVIVSLFTFVVAFLLIGIVALICGEYYDRQARMHRKRTYRTTCDMLQTILNIHMRGTY